MRGQLLSSNSFKQPKVNQFVSKLMTFPHLVANLRMNDVGGFANARLIVPNSLRERVKSIAEQYNVSMTMESLVDEVGEFTVREYYQWM